MLRFVRSRSALSTFIAALVSAATFVYFRPLTIAHWGGHVQLFLAGMHAHTTVVGPHRVRYFEGGEGPPLVLIHGIASSSEDFAMVVGALVKQHRVYAPDLLGYGGTDRPPDIDYSIATQSEFVRQFLDAMHLQRPDVVGWSMGGWVALRLAALHPERVNRLVLVDSAGLTFPTALTESTFTPKTMAEARALLELQSDRLARLPQFIVRDYFRRARHEDFAITRGMRSMLSAHDALDGKLQRVTMPVLIVWGAKDRITPPSLVPRFQRELPQAKVVMVPDCGHLALVECRGEALPPIVNFLGSKPQ